MILMKLLVASSCPTREIPVGVISLSSDKRKWIFIKNTPFYGFIVPYPGDKIYHISMNFRVYFSNPMGEKSQALKSLNPCGFSLVLSNQPHGFRKLFYSRSRKSTDYTVEELKIMIWRYFMSYWNNRRICSSIGGMPPAVKRRRYYENLKIAA